MKITVYDDNRAPYEVTLKKNRVSFGRLAGNDIVLNADFVSREHGCFYINGGSLYVEDRGSTNGIYYKGSRVSKRQLVAGDVVEIYKNGHGGRCVKLVVSSTNVDMNGSNSHGANMYPNYQQDRYSDYNNMPQTPPQYAQTYAYGSAPVNMPTKTSGMAIASMVLGVLSILLCCVLPVVPVIMAIMAIIFFVARDKNKAGNGMAIAGLVCGIITCGYYIVAIIYAIAYGSMINAIFNVI